jgi:hypothetical protein
VSELPFSLEDYKKYEDLHSLITYEKIVENFTIIQQWIATMNKSKDEVYEVIFKPDLGFSPCLLGLRVALKWESDNEEAIYGFNLLDPYEGYYGSQIIELNF